MAPTVWLSVGCSSSAPPSATTTRAPEPSVGPVPTPRGPEQVPRPIDPFLPTADELVAIERANMTRVNACLASGGAVGSIAEGDDLTGFARGLVADRRRRSNLYGFFDPASARVTGYARPPGSPSSYAPVVPASIPSRLLDDCFQRSDQDSGGLSLTMEGSALPGGGPPTPTTDTRYLQAARTWSECMTARGYDYLDPLAAATDERWRQERNVASPQQVAVATADSDCKVSTNLVGVAVAVQAAYDQRYIGENQAALSALHYTASGR